MKIGSNWKKLSKKLKQESLSVHTETLSVHKESLSVHTETLSVHTESLSIVKKKDGKIGKYLAIDCEMVGVGKDGKTSVLARVSIVNYHGVVLLDEYVLPLERVTDYRTQVSGITPELLLKKGLPFKIVQKRVYELLKNKIVIGHALKNDFDALMLDHSRKLTRDTATFKPLKNQKTNRPKSLKLLAKEYLNKDIQQESHSSVVDAQCTMEIYKLFKNQWESTLYNKH
jgi:RNA exonuclease 4